MTPIDVIYADMLNQVQSTETTIKTRNHEVKRVTANIVFEFKETPLVTLRKTAYRKAISEFEWFMSGDDRCPDNLLDWWKGQLGPDNRYLYGYATQLRGGPFSNGFDQVKFVLDALMNNPNSRRIITTTWDADDMANITHLNSNPSTPTTCHGTMVQYYVNGNKLDMFHFQRSADLLLGLPHNLIQYWAYGLYLARHSELTMGKITWMIGDAHIYQDESHVNAVQEIVDGQTYDFNFPEIEIGEDHVDNVKFSEIELVYNYSGKVDRYDTPRFLASDFTMVGDIPEPASKGRPKLF